MMKTFSDIERLCEKAAKVNEECLKRLLADNRDTEFGKKYSFAQIQNIREYQERVPLAQYEDLKPYIDHMLRGHTEALTAYPLAGFCLTSGSESIRKKIPVTCKALEQYSDYIEWQKNKVHKDKGGKRLLLNGFRVRESHQEGLLSELYYSYLFWEAMLSFDDYAGGEPLIFHEPGEGLMFAKAWVGIATDDVTIIESIFLYDHALFFQYLEEHWEELLECMEAGRIPQRETLSEELKAYLLAYPINEERLRKVRREFERGFDGIAPRLWERLALCSGISSDSFAEEEKLVKRWLGGVPVSYFAYVASECHMGASLRPGDYRFVMLPESAFYEYLPYPEDGGTGDEKTYLPQEVKTGNLYEIVVTNFSGLYRYRMGDVVKIAGFLGESPVVEFVLRKNQLLNIAGEKMSIQQVEWAVGEIQRKYQLHLEGYCVARLGHGLPARYGAVFSVRDGDAKAVKDAAEGLDQCLRAANADYDDLRDLRFLGEPGALLLSRAQFAAFMEETGILSGHVKPHHMAECFEEDIWEKWRRTVG